MRSAELNAELFEILKRSALTSSQRSGALESTAERVRRAVHFARFHHPGRLTDYELERLLRELGKQVYTTWRYKPGTNREVRRVVHVATSLHSTGGHSRVVQNWIRRDSRREHYVTLTDQSPGGDDNVILTEVVQEAIETAILTQVSTGVEHRAAALRDFISKVRADVVILHTDPQDVVAAVALRDCPVPVAFFDHADHLFSLGRLYADTIINFREVGGWHRDAAPADVIPLPVGGQMKALGAETSIQDQNGSPIFVTMASAYKFAPFRQHNFLRALTVVLDRVPTARLYLIGLDEATAKTYAGGDLHPRIHPVGEVIQPKDYLANAHYFLEPYPFGTILGTLEAILEGATPVVNYFDVSVYAQGARSIFPLSLQREFPAYTSEAEYVDWIVREAESGAFRARATPLLRAYVQSSSVHEWGEHVERLYDRIGKVAAGEKEALAQARNARADELPGHETWAEFRGDPMPRFLRLAQRAETARDRLRIAFRVAQWARQKRAAGLWDVVHAARLVVT